MKRYCATLVHPIQNNKQSSVCKEMTELTILPTTGGHVATDNDKEPDNVVEPFAHVRTGDLEQI